MAEKLLERGLPVEPGNAIDTMILEKLEQRPEAADVVLTDECFDCLLYTSTMSLLDFFSFCIERTAKV